MRRALLLLAALLAAVPALTARPAAAEDSALARHDRGLELYEAEDYDAAVDAFQEVLAAGVDDPRVHYNLGNAYFKAGRLGFAIWHYRKAMEMAPRDEDIRSNLEYARFLALDSIEENARTDTRVRDWLDRVTAREVLLVASALWLLAALAMIAWQLGGGRGRLLRRIGNGLLLAWAAVMVVAAVVDHRARNRNEAVVLAREAIVRNGPGETFDTAFVLHEGAEAVVEGERGRWTEISLPGELRGWIEGDRIGRL
ncbi:tetratricopeptide repeat protein [bacterium]|nr:tetratricopeptide repeat protein [bacterium]